MKIGIDCRLPAYRQGGISQYVLSLLPALAAIDKSNDYIVLHHRTDGRSHLPEDAGNFRRRRVWTPCHHRLERIALAAEVWPSRLDILHSPDFIPPVAGARRRVITVHDLNFLHYPQFLTQESRRYYAGQIEWAVRVADHILADSEHTRQDLMGLLGVPAAKVTAVPLAADPRFTAEVPATAAAQTLARWGLAPGFILFVGTLEPRKNIPTLLEAFARLRRSARVTVPLVLVGRTGWLMEEIEATIKRLGVRSHVRHLAKIDDRQLLHLYSAAALLALPSFYEGFGLPVLEAMSAGCPVVCSDRGSLPEVAGAAGMLLPADDVGAWEEGLGAVLGDDRRRQSMVAAGRRQAAQFSWARTAAQTLAVYEKTADGA